MNIKPILTRIIRSLSGFRFLWLLILLLLAVFILIKTWPSTPKDDSDRPSSSLIPSLRTVPKERSHYRSQNYPTIRGTVVNEEMKPISGARVCTVCPNCDIVNSPSGHCTLTQRTGQYILANISAGTLMFSATASGYLTKLVTHKPPLELTSGDTIEDFDIVLKRHSPNLSGRVLDATGGPIAGAKIQVAESKYYVHIIADFVTDENGFFEAAIDSSKPVTILASADGYAPSLAFRQLPSSNVQFFLTPGSTIEGMVVDAKTGEGVPGVDVRAVGEFAAALTPPTTSDTHGRFTLLGLEPGTYRVSGEGPHERGQASSLVRIRLAEYVDGVTIPVHRGALIRGQVLIGDSNRPCEEGYVTLGPETPISLIHRVESESTRMASDISTDQLETQLPEIRATIGTKGEVQLRGVPPGHYFVTLDCRSNIYQSGPITLDVKSEDQIVTWRVRSGLSLLVFVKDAHGYPIPNAPMSLTYPSASGHMVSMPLSVDSYGQAHLTENLFPGRYIIHPDPVLEVEPVEVELKSSDDTRRVEIIVPGDAKLQVRVQDPNGKPIDQVLVQARPLDRLKGDRGLRTGVAKGGGTFEFLSSAVWSIFGFC